MRRKIIAIFILIFSLYFSNEAFAFTGAGAGTAGNPYQITSWSQLNEIRNSLSSNYILNTSLSSTTTGYAGIGNAWIPVGSDSSNFTGSFNGNNQTISDLVISRSGLSYVGFFGYTTGNISDINLTNITIVGRHYVGALVGLQNGGTISNSSTSGTINADGASNLYLGGLVGRLTAGAITDSSSSVSVTGISPSNAGGLVGYQNAGTITNSHASGNITTGSEIGGLVGYQNAGTITNCYATGNIDKGSISTSNRMGGLIGTAKGSITSSYSTGTVNGYSHTGGLVGHQITGTITDSYATGNVTTTQDYSGGLVGYQDTTTSITNSYASGNVVASYNGHAGGLVGIYYGSLISNSYARGNVTAGGQIGGLVGGQWAAGTISYSYSTGAVTLTSGSSAGGLIGYKSAGTFTSCYWNTQTSGQATSAGGAGVVGKTTAEMQTQGTFIGWDFASVWTMAGYPYLTAMFNTLSYSANAGGSITGSSPQSVVINGSGSEVTATPNTGYHFTSWSDGVLTASRTDTNVTVDATYTASFAINSYTLTYTAGANGTLTGSATQSVDYGSNGTQVTAVPNADYRFVEWSDGVLTASRTDLNIADNLSVTASFVINQRILNYYSGSNGTLTGSTTQSVTIGQDGIEVIAVPNTGYHFTSWSDGVLTASRTDTNVQNNINATSSYLINTYTLSYTSGAGGTLSGSSTQSVNHGSNGIEVIAVPNTGYHFMSWSNDASVNASRTDANITGNISSTANFAIDTHTLTYIAGEHGTISGSSTQTIDYGSDGEIITAIPDIGYRFVQWSDGIMTASRTDLNITDNFSATSSFQVNSHRRPATPQCSSFEYTNWGYCMNGIQTREILSYYPENCVGGEEPIISQICFIPIIEVVATTTEIVATTTIESNIPPIVNNPSTNTSQPPVSTFSFNKDIKTNNINSDVKLLQIYLNTHGFIIAKTGPGSPGKETNIFGALTKKALIRFQEANAKYILIPIGLKKGTGYFGKSTRDFINLGI